jgi:hypothetical protein
MGMVLSCQGTRQHHLECPQFSSDRTLRSQVLTRCDVRYAAQTVSSAAEQNRPHTLHTPLSPVRTRLRLELPIAHPSSKDWFCRKQSLSGASARLAKWAIQL